MAIGTGSNGKDWDEDTSWDDENISPLGKRDWLEEESDENVSPVGKKDWLEDEED